MADDLSSASIAPRGVDLVAGKAGAFVRGQSTPQSDTKTAVATLPAVELAGHGAVRVDLVVSAATGTTPSMTVVIETSYDNGVTDAWHQVATTGAVTAAGTTRVQSTTIDRWVRARISALTGTTPSFTYTLSGEAV